ncbi:transposase [Cribrihabitans sp. XS_ASV171]
MSAAAKDLDLSVLPPDYRAAFEALQAQAARAAELEEVVKRLEHLVAELNHVVHGKKSEKLHADDRQLAFEDLEIAIAEAREQKQIQAPGEDTSERKRVALRNRGNLPAGLVVNRGPATGRHGSPSSRRCPASGTFRPGRGGKRLQRSDHHSVPRRVPV